MDVSDSWHSLLEDDILVTNRINIHRCSNYCLQLPKTGENLMHVIETKNNQGKPIRNTPVIIRDKKIYLDLKCSETILLLYNIHNFILKESKRRNSYHYSVDEITATGRYVSDYTCKGNQPTSALVELFHDLAWNQNEYFTANAKSICTNLLMNTVKRDILVLKLLLNSLFRCSHKFQCVNLTGSRTPGYLKKKIWVYCY